MSPAATRPTREAVAAAVWSAFDSGPTTKAGLLSAAVGSEAPPAVLDLVHELPSRSYSHVRDLWDHLPDLAVD